MLCLSNDEEAILSLNDRKQIIDLGDRRVELFLGKSAEHLERFGYLNMLVRDRSERLRAWSISEIMNSKIVIKNQERMKQLNVSSIIHVYVDNSEIHAQTWDGFLTVFSTTSLDLLRQEFTK